MLCGFGRIVDSADFPLVAGDGFLALGGNALEHIVAAFDNVPCLRDTAQVAVAEFIELQCEAFGA